MLRNVELANQGAVGGELIDLAGAVDCKKPPARARRQQITLMTTVGKGDSRDPDASTRSILLARGAIARGQAFDFVPRSERQYATVRIAKI